MPLEIEILKPKFYQDSEVSGNIALAKKIEAQYGGIINEVCSVGYSNLEPFLLIGLFFVESRGDAKARNGAALGIGQIDQKTASNIPFWLNSRAKIMTTGQKDMIVKLFGQKKADCMLGLKWDNSPSTCSGGRFDSKTRQLVGPDSTELVTVEQLLNPVINIWLASMFFDYLVDKYSTGGTVVTAPTKVRFDRLITHYNAGQGNAAKLPKASGALDTLRYVSKNISPITSDYILKIVGTNGMYDVLTR